MPFALSTGEGLHVLMVMVNVEPFRQVVVFSWSHAETLLLFKTLIVTVTFSHDPPPPEPLVFVVLW